METKGYRAMRRATLLAILQRDCFPLKHSRFPFKHPIWAHFWLKRSRIAAHKASARALLPETRADEGSRSPDARTSDHNARGVRAAGQSPDSQPGSGDGKQRQAEAATGSSDKQRQGSSGCRAKVSGSRTERVRQYSQYGKKLFSKFFIFVEANTLPMNEHPEFAIDLDKIIASKSKGKKLPAFLVNWMKRLLHLDFINE